jgi:hypothetical protein
MADETVVVIPEPETPPETTDASIDAAQAEQSAQAAAEAAAAAIAMADVVAARAADGAAAEMSAYEQRLNECQTTLSSVIQKQDASYAEAEALRGQMAGILTTLESIQSRLAPPPEPSQSSQAEPAPSDAEGDPQAAAEEPAPVARPRAHRWI